MQRPSLILPLPILNFVLKDLNSLLDWMSLTSLGDLLYVRESLLTKPLPCTFISPEIQCSILEVNLRSRKWLGMFVYRNPSQDSNFFLGEITKALDYYSRSYSNIFIIGDFNSTISERPLISFINNMSLKSLIHDPTCFKSDAGRCIDLILTNRPGYFQKSQSFETGISDHHHLVYTMLKTKFQKCSPKHV